MKVSTSSPKRMVHLLKNLAIFTAVSAPYAWTSLAFGEDTEKTENSAVQESKEKVEQLSGTEASPKKSVVVNGVAQTLPKNVIRARIISNTVTGTYGYNPDGKKEDLGINLYLNAMAYAVDYGITDRLTFQMGIPVVARERTSMDANVFRKSDTYKAGYKEVTDFVAAYATRKGFCPSFQNCKARIEDGSLSFPFDTAFYAPTTGEVVDYKAGTLFANRADQYVVTAAEPQKGLRGPSDLRMGVGYMAYSDPNQILTFGLGATVPTGAYDKPGAYRAPGRGFKALTFLTLYDYRLHPSFVISGRYEAESLLNKIKRHRTSQINPTEFNTSDPTIDLNGDGAVDGDGVANEYEVSRKGIKNTLGIKLSSNLSYVHHYLTPISWGYSLTHAVEPKYDNQSPPSLWGYKGKTFDSNQTSQTFNVSLDGLNMEPRLPISLSYAKTTTLKAKATAIATSQDEISLALFYKF